MKLGNQRFFLSLSSNTSFAITLILALFAPLNVFLDPGYILVFSTFWSVTIYPAGNSLFELTGFLSISFFVAVIRCLFANQVKQYYEYKARFVHTLTLGLIIEFFLEVGYIIEFMLFPIPLALPTPFMVVVGWFLMRRRPQRVDEHTWVEEESSGVWESRISDTKNHDIPSTSK